MDEKIFEEKKILILGGNPETAALVRVANELGLVTYVVDLVENSPAKRVADFGIDGNAADVDFLSNIIKSNKIDGVLVGVADILVPAYEEVCRLFDFPCYANSAAINIFCTKDGFIKACKTFDINTIPNYTSNIINKININLVEFPVMVKPVDSGGGVGMTIAHDFSELLLAVDKAKSNSRVGRFICEKYMTGQDIQVYYTFVDGEIYLSSVIDRKTNTSQGNISPVCIGASYNSIYKELFIATMNNKFINLFKNVGIKNGVMSIQCFVEGDQIYPYDPGFRLQGEGQHLMLNAINGFDHREMLINFAMSGSMWPGNFSIVNDINLRGKRACSVWILLSCGVISSITGLDFIRNMPNFLDIVQRFDIGDEVLPSFIGTEKQVFARIYIASNKLENLRLSISFIHNSLAVLNSSGNNMIIDYYGI
jgi:hypothetical protein